MLQFYGKGRHHCDDIKRRQAIMELASGEIAKT